MNTWDDLLGVSGKQHYNEDQYVCWSCLVVVLIQQICLSETCVEGDGEPLSEGLLGAVRKP